MITFFNIRYAIRIKNDYMINTIYITNGYIIIYCNLRGVLGYQSNFDSFYKTVMVAKTKRVPKV